MNGIIDDLMLFAGDFAQTDIQTIMNAYVPNDMTRILQSLNNQWTFNQNVLDSMTSLNMVSVVNIQFVADRLGAPNSAVYLNAGYMQAPSDIYFSGDFSATAWVYVMCACTRLFDFGNGQALQVS